MLVRAALTLFSIIKHTVTYQSLLSISPWEICVIDVSLDEVKVKQIFTLNFNLNSQFHKDFNHIYHNNG